MKKVETILLRTLEAVMALCFLSIFCLVVVLVVLRYFFNSSITGANEIIVVLFVYTTSIGGAIAAGKREHIAIPMLVEKLPEKIRRTLESFGLLLVAVINGVMVWFSIQWIGITGDYLMPSTGLPRIVAQLSVPIGCGLATIYCAIKAFCRA
jgi:TRAP-type C4-dicarboxylate transport system permease small subunit